jgi:hypothetical protein
MRWKLKYGSTLVSTKIDRFLGITVLDVLILADDGQHILGDLPDHGIWRKLLRNGGSPRMINRANNRENRDFMNISW